MEFKIIVSTVNDLDDKWTETYNEETPDPVTWGKEVIDRYNRTLRPGETARVFHGVEMVGEGKNTPHKWEKTNSFTQISRGGGTHDVMRCKNCRITGKRHNLSSGVARDPEYKAAVYAFCDTAQAHTQKRRKQHPA